MNPAGGTTRNGKDVKWLQGKRRINVTLDNDMFDEIRARAVKEKTTFAEQVQRSIDGPPICVVCEICISGRLKVSAAGCSRRTK